MRVPFRPKKKKRGVVICGVRFKGAGTRESREQYRSINSQKDSK